MVNTPFMSDAVNYIMLSWALVPFFPHWLSFCSHISSCLSYSSVFVVIFILIPSLPIEAEVSAFVSFLINWGHFSLIVSVKSAQRLPQALFLF